VLASNCPPTRPCYQSSVHVCDSCTQHAADHPYPELHDAPLQAKLADFGLHKRVRKMTSSGALVAWNQETTYHGAEFERSFYGGKLYLVKSAMSIASSMRDDDSVYDGSLHGGGSMHGASMNGGSVHGGGSLHGGAGWQRAHGSSSGVLGLPPVPPAAGGSLPSSNKPPLAMRSGSVAAAAGGGGGGGQGMGDGAGLKCFDSAASISDSTAAAGSGKQQQHQQQELLNGAVRAKSQGLLGKQEFVTRMLSVSSSSTPLQQVRNTTVHKSYRQALSTHRVLLNGDSFFSKCEPDAGV